jgi:hypothetical protein
VLRSITTNQPIRTESGGKPQAACHRGNARVGLRVSAGPLRVAPQPRR